LPRSAFYPLIGKRIHGPIGDAIDTFAVLGTMFGVATSLGFGVSQVNAGLDYLYGIGQTTGIQVILIAIITLFATVSVVLGLDGGIKKLSNVNMILAVVLLGFVLLAGDTVFLLKSYVQNTGTYLSDIVYKTFNLYAYEKKEDWIGGWTLLYWGWWVSWAPFVGMFIARISRGRTIREFILGVLFVPTGFTFLWMTVFGNSAIDLVLNSGKEGLAEAISGNVPVALFRFLEFFPMSSFISIVAVLLIVTFFVSSSDSGSLVIDTLTSGGAKEPPVWQRIYWAVMEGLVAAALLLAGGLDALQTMTIASAFPMMILILIACYAFVKSLREDYLLLDAVQNHQTSVQYAQASTPWRDRLASLIAEPTDAELVHFLKSSVEPALLELSEELKKKGLETQLENDSKDSVGLTIRNKGVENFKYQVQIRQFTSPSFSIGSSDKFCRAEVFIFQGGQQYDVYGYTKDQVIADFLTQYEKHMHYLHISNMEHEDTD
ncbi:MAG: choline transporter, partial [Bdellovibrionaceae bacterium]|nr:choline transporter [Pseudobdellovibrionaceae bacterium]